MRAKPRKSALDNPNLTISQTADVANDTLNEMQRNNGGDTVSEDDSRYQVTIHIPNSTDIPDWMTATLARSGRAILIWTSALPAMIIHNGLWSFLRNP